MLDCGSRRGPLRVTGFTPEYGVPFFHHWRPPSRLIAETESLECRPLRRTEGRFRGSGCPRKGASMRYTGARAASIALLSAALGYAGCADDHLGTGPANGRQSSNLAYVP